MNYIYNSLKNKKIKANQLIKNKSQIKFNKN